MQPAPALALLAHELGLLYMEGRSDSVTVVEDERGESNALGGQPVADRLRLGAPPERLGHKTFQSVIHGVETLGRGAVPHGALPRGTDAEHG